MAKTGTGQYAPVADALRRDITSGALAPGAWLPSEAQVMQIYQVSRYAAREAIKRLAGEGLIIVMDGKGSYVRNRRDRAAHADTRGLRCDIDPHGHVRYMDAEADHWHTTEEQDRYRTTATMDLALSLGVAEHTPVFVYDRLLTHNSAPTPALADGEGTPRRMIHRFYLPVATCTDIPALTDNPFRAPAEVYTLLAQAGRELRWVEHVRATIPTPDDTTTLTIPTGLPVLITRRVTTDTDGRPIAMEETRRSAEDTQLSYPQTPTTE
ncbi:MAG: GntR family transcriptional regulator [Pseudonocardiaceae bacterium]